MAIELDKNQTSDMVVSLQRYFRDELEFELSEMRARFLLSYVLKEIAPFAYNQGVKDSEAYFHAKAEDLSGACFEPTLTYWVKKKK